MLVSRAMIVLRIMWQLRTAVPATGDHLTEWQEEITESGKINGSRERNQCHQRNNAVKRPDHPAFDPVTALRSVPGCHCEPNIRLLITDGMIQKPTLL